jgi:hypothetical protein
MNQRQGSPSSSTTLARTRLLLIAATAVLASSCFEPRAKYHRDDYRFSWQQEDADEERRAGMVYTQAPKATSSAQD